MSALHLHFLLPLNRTVGVVLSVYLESIEGYNTEIEGQSPFLSASFIALRHFARTRVVFVCPSANTRLRPSSKRLCPPTLVPVPFVSTSRTLHSYRSPRTDRPGLGMGTDSEIGHSSDLNGSLLSPPPPLIVRDSSQILQHRHRPADPLRSLVSLSTSPFYRYPRHRRRGRYTAAPCLRSGSTFGEGGSWRSRRWIRVENLDWADDAGCRLVAAGRVPRSFKTVALLFMLACIAAALDIRRSFAASSRPMRLRGSFTPQAYALRTHPSWYPLVSLYPTHILLALLALVCPRPLDRLHDSPVLVYSISYPDFFSNSPLLIPLFYPPRVHLSTLVCLATELPSRYAPSVAAHLAICGGSTSQRASRSPSTPHKTVNRYEGHPRKCVRLASVVTNTDFNRRPASARQMMLPPCAVRSSTYSQLIATPLLLLSIRKRPPRLQ
ncbi:hypothetical protein R3P38DRAFT_3245861 [Favolaschia claudopus]|uniref:Uncharacterized protein n=1 Tax=Favolaschia claudopus TaxID=2862362 RepID=A0AAV9Z047_9AGAR